MASSSSTAAFAPEGRPAVSVAGDGTLAAIHERTRVTIVEVPSCASFAELGIDGDASSSDIAWVGTPPRLVVLSRYATHTSVHLVDPLGPRSIAELRLEASMRILAAAGTHAVIAGAAGVAILTASDRTLTPHQFPARAIPIAAGAAGNHVMVALSGAIEEWDPQSRMPKRRLKLPRPATITAVGGSDRVVWLTTQQEPTRLDVIALVNRGQPKAHDLPEPIESVSSHPRCDLVACVGATTGRIFIVDLDGRSSLRAITAPGIDRADAAGLVLGRVAGVLAAQATRAITLVSLDRADDAAEVGSAPPPAAVRKSSLFGGSGDHGEGATSVMLASPPLPQAPETPAEPPAAEPTRPSRQVLTPPFAASDKLQPPALFSTSSSPRPMSAPAPHAAMPPPTTNDARAVSETQPFPFAGSGGVPVAETNTRAQGSGGQRSSIPPPAADARAIDDTQPPPALTNAPRASTPPPTRRDARAVAETQLPSFGEADRPTDSGVPLPPLTDARAVDETQPISFAAPPRVAAARAPSVPPPVKDARAIDDTVPPSPTSGTRAASLSTPPASADRFKVFRERIAQSRASTDVPAAPLWTDSPPEWRDELVSWAQRVRAGEREAPPASPADLLAARFDLTGVQTLAIARLYAEHLLGSDGMAPVDVARISDGATDDDRWTEALGRGDLARRGLATYVGSRVRLADVVLRALDEVPPRTGVLVGAPGMVSLLGACSIVASGPLRIIAEACVPSIGGAILAAHPQIDPAELVAEARVYGAAPLWRVQPELLERIPAEQPIILVVDDDATADRLGVPRLT